mmetsp:Transcript_9090/g.14752  ORF Transcript_9090/g.14752 Transcript_9090/m.14752 type:complete len:131 (-) Transcript_9090:750-1142(-)
MDLLEILRDALLPFLLPSDMMRFTTTSLQVAQALPLVARRSAAAERPSEGWHLVNYARYAEPKDLDFAWSLLARGSSLAWPWVQHWKQLDGCSIGQTAEGVASAWYRCWRVAIWDGLWVLQLPVLTISRQ